MERLRGALNWRWMELKGAEWLRPARIGAKGS